MATVFSTASIAVSVDSGDLFRGPLDDDPLSKATAPKATAPSPPYNAVLLIPIVVIAADSATTALFNIFVISGVYVDSDARPAASTTLD